MTNYVYPFPKSSITCKFGVKDALHPNGHRGTDGVPEFAIACADGEIAQVKWSGMLGNTVVIKDAKGTFWGYSHMRAACRLAVGAKVKAGDKLGVTGNSGAASSGRHLHFTCGYDVNAIFWGDVVDGFKVLDKRMAAQKPKISEAIVETEPSSEAEVPQASKIVSIKKVKK